MSSLKKFEATHLEAICRLLVDAVSHREVTSLLRDCKIDEVPGSGPRWERMLAALSQRQDQDGCSNNALAFISKALHPSRFQEKAAEFQALREKTNYQLSFYGFHIREDGMPVPVPPATTISEAAARASELRVELERRAVHDQVLRFCEAEYLEQNFFHCVLEATKSVFERLRQMSGLGTDGNALVDVALLGQSPLLAINGLQTDTERSEQTGFGNLLKGIFGTFRNTTAHAPKIYWAVNKRDAWDVLTLLSFVHRRLDGARRVR